MQSASIVAATDRLAAWPQRRLTGDHRLVTIRFSGGCAGPRESITVRLTGPYGSLPLLDVQGCRRASTAVVSTALATGLSIRRPDLPLPWRGVKVARSLHSSLGSNRQGMGGAYSLPGESWLLRAISSANRFSISGHFSIARNVGSSSYGAG